MIKSNRKRLQLIFERHVASSYYRMHCIIVRLQEESPMKQKNKVIFMDIQTHEQNHFGQRALQKVRKHGQDV